MSSSIEIVQREIGDALARQDTDDAALDVKIGLVLALDGAALVGALTAGRVGPAALNVFWAALLLILVSTAASLYALFPKKLNHPPEPFAFAAAHGLKAGNVESVLRELMFAQLRAWNENNEPLRRRLRVLVGATIFAVAGTLCFVAQAILSETITRP